MCKYCGTTKYRKIYENHHGTIPTDQDGRTYEIHHIDGNHSNNYPDNLVAVTIQEHHDIHYSQGDWAACLLISRAMNLSSEKKAELARKSAVERMDNGTHNFTDSEFRRKHKEMLSEKIKDGSFHFLDSNWAREKELKKVENGSHPFLKKENGTSVGQQTNKQRVESGTHNLLGPESNRRRFEDGTHPILKMLETGTHPSHVKWTCSHCGKMGQGKSQLSRHTTGKNCIKTDKYSNEDI